MAGTSAGLAIQVAFLVVLGVGGARVDSGAISVATLVAFLLYVMYLTQPVLQLVNAGTYFQAGRAAIGRIGEVTRLGTEDVDPDGAARAGARPPSPRRRRRARRGRPGVGALRRRLAHLSRAAPSRRSSGFTLDVPPGG